MSEKCFLKGENMRKILLILLLFSSVFLCYGKKLTGSGRPTLAWKEDGGPRYVTYMTLTGKTGFITTPSAFCAPMGSLLIGFDTTYSTKSPYGFLAAIGKITFTPVWFFEFGFSKALSPIDTPSAAGMYFDSTPFFIHYKFRFLNWHTDNDGVSDGAVAFGQDFDILPAIYEGGPSRGFASTTIYVMFTGVTTIIGSFNFGFGKTFYFTTYPDLLFNFYASWVYSFAQLDDRLQLCIDFSNADYRSGDDRFKVATEDRAYLNFMVRGVIMKRKRFHWTAMFALYDLLDLDGTAQGAMIAIGLNASLGMTFNIDLY